jgi:hypothetical protein
VHPAIEQSPCGRKAEFAAEFVQWTHEQRIDKEPVGGPIEPWPQAARKRAEDVGIGQQRGLVHAAEDGGLQVNGGQRDLKFFLRAACAKRQAGSCNHDLASPRLALDDSIGFTDCWNDEPAGDDGEGAVGFPDVGVTEGVMEVFFRAEAAELNAHAARQRFEDRGRHQQHVVPAALQGEPESHVGMHVPGAAQRHDHHSHRAINPFGGSSPVNIVAQARGEAAAAPTPFRERLR